jgi:hypothetical protein
MPSSKKTQTIPTSDHHNPEQDVPDALPQEFDPVLNQRRAAMGVTCIVCTDRAAINSSAYFHYDHA